MKLNNEIITLFDSELLFESVIGDIQLYIFANHLNYVYVPSFERISMPIAKQLREVIKDFYGDSNVDFCNIIHFELNADVDPEARDWAAKRPEDVTSICDAIITQNSMAQRMLVNFYLKVNRPKKPTRFFNDLQQGIQWSLEQLVKRD